MLERGRDPEVARLAISKFEAGATVDDVLTFLRRSGFLVVDCVPVLVQAGVCAPEEAKGVIYNSAAWADKRDLDIRFRETLIQGLFDKT